ncbi:MAG: hypothetical protein IT290_00585, partial [Deltaproteobacteria bacterium]|nr:hypothetical protein [Deltaproteobacteria bacterium]
MTRALLQIAFVLCALVAGPLTVAAQTVEVYPGPGTSAYQSNFYSVEILDGATWRSAYVYKYSRSSKALWHNGANPSVNFMTFGTVGTATVRVTNLRGAITAADASPKSKNIPVQVSGTQATLTLNQNDKAWVTINGDDANPLFIFADPLKPAGPAGATYFGPGARDIAPATGNHYRASNNEVIYVDGGALLRGNIDVRGRQNVQIMGPGVLSGELWTAEFVQSLQPWPAPLDYAMVTGDWAGVNATSIKGITIVNSPSYNISAGVDLVSGVKLLSPWYWSTDGFQSGVSTVDQSFAFVGDNVFFPIWAGLHNNDVVVTNSFAGTTNNSVFAGGFWGNHPSNTHTSFADNIDIKTYNNDSIPGWTRTPAAVQVWVDNVDPTYGHSNQTYQNIRIEGPITTPLIELKNLVHPWANVGQPAPDPALGNSYNFLFKNITLTGTQKYRSELKGWNALNGFHNVVFENVRMNGTLVTTANASNYFDINSFIWGLVFRPGPPVSCDINADGFTDVNDVQVEINQVIERAPCT